jgi:hypothetical protein
MPEAERILMVDFTATQARAKGATPSANREGGHTGAMATKTRSALLSPTANGVDMTYRQLEEIHAIAAVQLAECTHYHQLAGACCGALHSNDSTTTTD